MRIFWIVITAALSILNFWFAFQGGGPSSGLDYISLAAGTLCGIYCLLCVFTPNNY